MTPRRRSRRPEPRAWARGSFQASRRPGYALVELLVVAGIVVAVLTAAVPVLDRASAAADAAGAARFLAARVAAARLDATRQQRTMAVRFTRTSPLSFVTAMDGDGDGVSTADLGSGVDVVTRPADRLEDHYARARFGIAADVPGIDGGPTLRAGDDPLRLGTGDQISLTPGGTATSGTVYIASRTGVQYAVRISGITGRARVLRYDGRGSWLAY